jgi:purine nucleosidase
LKQVWIDTDCGFDDFAAIAMVQAARHEWDIAGIGLVAGNAPLDVVVDNGRRIAAFVGLEAPLYAGRAAPLIGPLVTAQNILGTGAMKSAGASLPPAGHVAVADDAVAALIAALLSAPAPLTILALGPLTNIAVSLLARPAIAPRIAEIVWMGGSATTGNHTAAAEFNAAVDPAAAAIVLDSRVPFRMIGLDACRQVPVTLADVARLRQRGTQRACIAADLLDGYVRIASADGSKAMALYDPVAAAALVLPGAIACAPAAITVELTGTVTRGMTVCEFRAHKAAPHAAVARTANAAVIVDACLAAMAGD